MFEATGATNLIDYSYRCFVCGRTGMTYAESQRHWGDEFEGIYLNGRPVEDALNSNVPSAALFLIDFQ